MGSATILHEAIVEPPSADNPRNTEAAVIELHDGRLLLVWSDFYGGAGDEAAARISGRHSSNGGRTWGPKCTVGENIGKMNTFCPSLLRLQSGRLGLTYIVKDAHDSCRVFWRVSTDDGLTWSDPAPVTAPNNGYDVIAHDRAVQLRTGRLIAPIQHTPEKRTGAVYGVYCCYSDDEGATWQRGSGLIEVAQRGAMEPAVVERRDGSVLMTIRTQLGDQYRAESNDGGVSWSKVRPMGLVGSESPANIKRLPSSGDLLIVWNHVVNPHRPHGGRTPLTTAVSRDDGTTWEHVRHIETASDHSFAYPSILCRENEVLLTYWVSREGSRNYALKVKILPVDWFYDAERGGARS